MRFAPTEQQELFASNVASILEKECSVEALQLAGERPSGLIDGLWETLSETGLMGIAIPEEFGGLGMGSSDLVFILDCLLYTSPSPRDGLLSRMPSSA